MGSGLGPPCPALRANPFPRSYGSILPTSLAYIVPSTRGCSPWRPDAVMSTTGRGRHSVLRIFKGRWERTGHHATCSALQAAGPYLRLRGFQEKAQVPPTHAADGARGAGYRFKYSLAFSALGFVGRPLAREPGTGRGARVECRSTPPVRSPQLLNTSAGSFCCAGFDNDPSACSPTETLLRLLIPLNDKVQWTSRDVAGSEPPTSTRFEHFTGSFNR
ncbi:hypothetical protein CQW23_35032 [Capsicum baccatum]|uniref:Protein TAR1 n=1 Tax=Capsicum baccatum TaxID=33114 RepID=A0A2G2UX67_CAPBA|nr:hypothetical protein CQW23_35032 [Capsicum baccatum]